MPVERTPGGGGSSAGGLVLLFNSTLGGAAANIDTGANGVASGHGHLVIMFVGRSSQATNIVDLFIRFNGDSGANYDDALMRNVGGAISGLSDQGVTSAEFGQVPGSTATANVPASVNAFIAAYDQTTFFKIGNSMSGYADSVAGNARMIFDTFEWRNTAAINQITVLPSAGNLIAGSRLTIYGTQ